MYNKYLITVFIVTGLYFSSLSQIQTKNPYSMIGIGLIENPGNFVNPGMGGVSTAFYNKNALNIANPAMLTYIDTLIFVGEFGVKTNISRMTTENYSPQIAKSANLNNFSFGFRGNKRWAASFGITPHSIKGYRIADNSPEPNGVQFSKYYVGSGGINKLFIGNCFDITKNFSLGLNANYLFGKLEETSTLITSNAIPNSYNTQIGTKQQVSGFTFLLGMNYFYKQSESSFYNFGITGTPKLKINAKETSLKGTIQRDNIWTFEDNKIVDTLKYDIDIPVKLDMPASISFGIGRSQLNKSNTSFDYTFTNWGATNYEDIRNSHRLALGHLVVPQWNSPMKYFKRVTYRMGAFYEIMNIEITDNKQNKTGINSYALTAGLGLPIRRGFYNCDLDLQVGQTGTHKNGNISDIFVRINVRIRFNEIWFYKPKYD